MAKSEPIIAIKADPADPEDFDVTEEALEAGLAERRKRGRGRPAGTDKERVSLRLDTAALDHFRAGGRGWQTRVNEALRVAAGLDQPPR